jgi:hypothetical protein
MKSLLRLPAGPSVGGAVKLTDEAQREFPPAPTPAGGPAMRGGDTAFMRLNLG